MRDMPTGNVASDREHEDGFLKKVGSNTSLALLELILTKVANVVAFIILIRLLGHQDIAAIGIAGGYRVFLAYLDISPMRVLLRDYPKYSADRQRRDEHLSALFVFWLAQTAVMLGLCYVIQLAVLSRLALDGLGFLFFAMAIDFIGITFQDWLKVVFYADFRQAIATRLALLFSVVRLLCYLAMVLSPSLENYAWILIGTSILAMVVWWITFSGQYSFRWTLHRKTLTILRSSLSDYGLWDHLNRCVIDTLFFIDTAILAWLVSTIDVSDYTVAMKFTSLLFIIPMQLRVALQLMLSHTVNRDKQADYLGALLKLTIIVSLMQLIFVIVLGKPAMQVLFGNAANQSAYTYALIQTIAVTLMSASLPFLSVMNNFCRLRDSFLSLFLPALVLGLPVYLVTAWLWGTIGIASANIVVYGVLSASLVLYVHKRYPLQLRFSTISDREKSILQGIFRIRANADQ